MAAIGQLEPEIIWSPQKGPQTYLISCPVGDLFFGGARGGGKSSGCIGKWISHAAKYGDKAHGVFFRRSFPELEEVQKQMMDLLPRLGATYKAQSRTWVMSNGATIKLRFLDNDADANKYQGFSLTIVIFDELGNWPSPEPIDKIRATLRSPHGVPCQMISTGNPGGVGAHWIKKRYIEPAPPMTPFFDEEARQQRVFIPSSLKDNQALLKNDPGYIDRLRGSGPLWLVKAWLEGDWNTMPEGAMLKASWFNRYRIPPANFTQIILSLDSSSKAKELNAPWSATIWGIWDGNYYLLDVWTRRAEYPEGKRTVGNLMLKWRPNVTLIEDKSTGQSLIQEYRLNGIEDGAGKKHYFNIIGISPTTDKITRMSIESPAIESGRVWLPESAPWLPEYELVMTTFPMSSISDPVDSTSMFLKHQREHSGASWDDVAVVGTKRVSSSIDW